jgi:hypothetical protein
MIHDALFTRFHSGVRTGWRWFALALLTAVPAMAQDDIENFKVPEIDEEGRLKSMFRGDKARIVPGKPMEVEGLTIDFFEPDGKTVKLNIVSPGCFYDSQKGVAVSELPIQIRGEGFRIRGVGYRYERDRERLEIHNKVRVRFRHKAPDKTPGTREPAPSEPEPQPAEDSQTPTETE